MSGGARIDVRQLQRLNQRLNRFAQADIDKFCEDCARELTARLLRKVIKRTPVGQYPKSTGKTGGTLRRGWTAATHAAAANGSGDGQAAGTYAKTVRVRRTGSLYCIRVFNPVQYFPYVEYGHRTSNHKAWVPGRFMLTMSVQEMQAQSQGIIDRKLTKFLGGVFDGSR